MEVDHIAGRHPAFAQWLSQSLRRCHEHYKPVEIPVEEEPPVPRDLFFPEFQWSDEAVQAAIQHVLQALDPATNPYLKSPEEMLATGFKGLPYGRQR